MNVATEIYRAPFEVLCANDSEGWLRARQGGIGASEIAAVLGLDPHRGPLEVYAQKVGAVAAADLSDVEAIEWGHRLEPVVAQAFADRTGRRIERGAVLLRSIEHPWALATLDYWTTDGSSAQWPLEIKTVGLRRADDWADGVPEYYLAQVTQQMLVTGTRRATVAALVGGQQLVWQDLELDETLARKIAYHGALFWERVQQRVSPDPDGSASTKRVLNQLFPADDGSTVELPMALAEIVDEWRSLKNEVSTRAKRIDEIENAIKATLGDASVGVLPTGDRVSWKAQTRKAYTVPESTTRVLRYQPTKNAKGRE